MRSSNFILSTIRAKKFPLTGLFLTLFYLSHFCWGKIPESKKIVFDKNRLPYHLKIKRKTTKQFPLDVEKYVDLNGDGVDECVCIRHETKLKLYGMNWLTVKNLDGSRVYVQYNIPELLMRYLYFYDLDGNGQKEVFCTQKTNNEIYLHILYNLDGSYVFKFPAISKQQYCPGAKPIRWDASLTPVQVMDFNNDGRLDVLTKVRTNYACYPRGIIVFDCINGKLIWKYLMGTQPKNVWIVDLDGDGRQEIVVSTWAPGNGAVANGTDDTHSYLMVLSQNGHLIWAKQLGGTFSGIITDIIDAEQDGQWEIVGVKHWHKAEAREKGFLTLWKGITGEQVKSVPFEESFSWIKSIDVNQDGKKEIVIGNITGKIKIFDSTLQLLKQIDLGFQLTFMRWLPDINLDGYPEVICNTYQGKMLLFNSNFEILATFNDCGSVQRIDPGFGHRKELLLAGEKYFYTLALERNLRYTISKWKYPGLGIALFVFLFAFGVLMWKISLQARESKVLARKILETTAHGILFLDKRGKVKFSNRNFEQMLDLKNPILANKNYQEIFANQPIIKNMIRDSYSNPPQKVEREIESARPDGKRQLQIQVIPLFERGARETGKLVIVKDQTEQKLMRKSLAWATMAQRLTHEIKNPLTTILLTLQRLQMEYWQKDKKRAPDYDKLVESIIERINHLTKTTRGFMKFTDLEQLNLQPHDVNTLLDRILNEYSAGIPDDITLKREFAPDLPKVNLDEEQFKTAMENLISNAINAMDKGGTLTITTSMAHKLHTFKDETRYREYVQIEVMDTGKGISPQNIEKLFQPYFSLDKKGTGLGLTIVKKIIEDHAGIIEVQSEEGMWTVFTIWLPV